MIIASSESSPDDDLLPEIRFQYEFENQKFENTLQFPAGTTPIPGFAEQYIERYPVGRTVSVFVDPRHPETSTLTPANGGAHGLIIAMGLLMAGIGLGAFFI